MGRLRFRIGHVDLGPQLFLVFSITRGDYKLGKPQALLGCHCSQIESEKVEAEFA